MTASEWDNIFKQHPDLSNFGITLGMCLNDFSTCENEREGYKNAYEIQKAHNLRAEREAVERERKAFMSGAFWSRAADRGYEYEEACIRYPLPKEGA